MNSRPLSPYLTYRFAYTMVLSFLHRIAGIALAVGALVLVLWLVAAANGPAAYGRFASWAGSPVFRVLLAGWLVAFVYHFANGIRHLFWDAGKGLERAQARRSAVVVVVLVVLVSAVLVYGFFLRGQA
jgi:succinate dehydrogenase / fumarate reductase, cytochrome b subunit